MIRYEGWKVEFADGQQLEPDLIVFATGFSYAKAHLEEVVDLDPDGRPLVKNCESTRTKGVFLLGYRFGRTFASPYLRGIARDAEYVAERIAQEKQIEMKAVRVKGFGGVDQLEFVELPDPEPKPGQVRIRVEACGLNYADVMQREGLYPNGPKPPFIPGAEAAGVVEAGDALPAGSRVVAISGSGCHADRVCVSAAACMPVPDSMSFVDAAAFPVQYLTAYHALTTVGRAEPGEMFWSMQRRVVSAPLRYRSGSCLVCV